MSERLALTRVWGLRQRLGKGPELTNRHTEISAHRAHHLAGHIRGPTLDAPEVIAAVSKGRREGDLRNVS